MRIAAWHNLPSGGGKRSFDFHVRGLVARGHTVEVWSPPMADHTYLPLGDVCREHRVPLDFDGSAFRTRYGNLVPRYRFTNSMLAAVEAHCGQCAAEIDRGGFDVLFANSCFLSACPPIGRYTKLPSAVYLQEPKRWLYEAVACFPWSALPQSGSFLASIKRLRERYRDSVRMAEARLLVREERESAGAYDRILLNSFFSRESILRAYGLRGDVCYLGVDPARFVDRGVNREGFVIGVGAFSWPKNIEMVIQSISTVASPRPRLVWVGNIDYDGYMDRLSQLARSLGVEFEPLMRVTDDELVDLLNRASVMAYAPRLEPFGLATLEANACGLPVVAVAEGGVRETIQHGVNGLLVEAEPDKMGDAIRSLLRDPSRAREMGRHARRIVEEKWTVDASVGRLEARLLQTAEHASAAVPDPSEEITAPASRRARRGDEIPA